MVEGEPKKFRPGESTNKPWGGKVSKKPLARAIHSVARAHGYESQLGLAKALGRCNNSMTRGWFVLGRVPEPEQFGQFLELIKPEDVEREKVVDPYCEALKEADRKNGNRRRVLSSRKLLRRETNPLGDWLRDFSLENDLSFYEIDSLLEKPVVTGLRQGDAGLDLVAFLLANAKERLHLSEEQEVRLSEAAANYVAVRIKKRHGFRNTPNTHELKKTKEAAECTLYNGVQVAKKLKVTPQAVSQHRRRLGLSYLMTDKEVEILRADIETAKK